MTHHKKKMTDKDREREKFEVRQARKATEQYRKRQEELARPPSPREPLKRTVGNNWVHITCAVWTQEVEFGNANALAPSEGIPSIPSSRFEVVCQVCNRAGGAVVLCQSHNCRKPCESSSSFQWSAQFLVPNKSHRSCGMCTPIRPCTWIRCYPY